MKRVVACLWSIVVVVLMLGMFFVSHAQAQSQLEPDSGFVEEVVLGDLPPTTAVVFGPEGRIFLALKDGIVRVAKDGVLLPTPFIDISAMTNRRSDRGLGGIALDPQFPARPYVYLFYSYDPPELLADDTTPRVSRLIRVQADAAKDYNVALPNTIEVILGKNSNAQNTAAVLASGSTILPEPASCMTGLTMDGTPIEDCIPSDEVSHSAGTIMFGSDGYLYASHGDASTYSTSTKTALRSQMLDSLAGKVLRIDPNTGSGVAGNPFFDSMKPTSNRSRVWAYGMRNPFRMMVSQVNGQVYLGDVGSSSWEEINAGKGANFGWPCYEGGNTTNDIIGTGNTVSLVNKSFQSLSRTSAFCGALYNQGLGAVVPPLFSYKHPLDANGKDLGASATGVALYSGTTYPAKYRGALFIADYAQRKVRYLIFDEKGVPSVNPFATETSPSAGPVQLTIGPDSNLYAVFLDLVARKAQVRRYRYTGSSNTPPTVRLSGSPVGGSVPLSVTFDTTGTIDVDGQGLSYTWDFGDGTGADENSPNPTHVYQSVGVFEASVIVRETTAPFAEATASVTIRTGVTPPRVHITTPLVGTTYAIGDTISYSGYAEFEGVRVPDSALTWTVIQEHNLHEHLVDERTGVSSGSFEPSEHSDNTRFIVCLYATAGQGLDDQACVTVHPRTTDVTFESEPTGAPITYIDEEMEFLAPYVIKPVQGSQQTVVPTAIHQGRSFSRWSDGSINRERSFAVGASPTTLKVIYENKPPTAVISASALGGKAPLTVTFNGSGSSDPEGAGLRYVWNLGDGQTADTVGSSKIFNQAGQFPVTLRVIDSLGYYAETTTTITVSDSAATNRAPVVVAPLPQTVRLGTPVPLQGTVYDDGLPSGLLQTSWSRVRGPQGVAFSPSNLPSTLASFTSIGTYLLKLESSDSLLRGAQNTAVTVNPATSPFRVVSLSLVNAVTDQVIYGYESIPNGAIIGLSALPTTSINVRANTQGTGIGSVVFLQDAALGTIDNSAPHSIQPSTSSDLPPWSYTRKRYLLTAIPYSLADGKGTQGDALTVQFTINTSGTVNSAPVAKIRNSPTSGTQPLTVTFDGSTSSDPQMEPLTYMWDFGNGNTSSRAITERTFTVPGTYPVTLTVRDPAGLTGSATTTITVGEIPTPEPTPVPINQAPLVDPGLARTVVLGSPMTLQGVVTDDGLPSNILDILWSRVRGPGTLTFSQPTRAVTDISASKAGTYLVKLSATDSVLRTSKNGVVTFNPPNATFSVSSIALVNAVTGAPFAGYESIPNGAVISLGTLGSSPKINLRASTAGGGIGSVRWLIDAVSVSTDSTSPYAIAPSTGADYPAWTYAKQLYRVTAVPYSGGDGTGTEGAALSVQFTLK